MSQKDFAGVNICIYDPIDGDSGSYGSETNTIGYDSSDTLWYTDSFTATDNNVGKLTSANDTQTLVLLNLHRNGVWGYSSWKQVRSGHNPLTRHHIKNSTYSFYGPGTTVNIQGFDYTNKYGPLEHKTEPMVSSKYAPLQYNFGYMMKDSRLAEFTLKADLTNECRFFTHDRMSELFAVELLTSEDYEQAKTMYLDNALNNSTNPIDSIELIKYRETVYPRESNTFLARTRQRQKYVSGFWRETRSDRKLPLGKEFNDTPSNPGDYSIYVGSNNPLVAKPSSWSLDARDDYLTSLGTKIGFDGESNDGTKGATSTGINLGGSDGAGILQNAFSQFGFFDQDGSGGTTGVSINTRTKSPYHLKDAPTYYHRHATRHAGSVVAPSGMDINLTPFSATSSISASLMLRGDIEFTAPSERTVFTTEPDGTRTIVSSPRSPFYDTYDNYAEHLRLVGKDYSVVPEFNISENLEFYLNAGASEKNLSLLSVKGAKPAPGLSTSSFTPESDVPIYLSNTASFYETYSNSDFLRMFDIVEVDNKDTITPSVLKLTCKAIKKFLPYDGFYPSSRTVQIADQFYKSYADMIETSNGGSQVHFDGFNSIEPDRVNLASASAWITGPARIKPINTAMFSPGILYNTIKSGIACDWPNIQSFSTASSIRNIFGDAGVDSIVFHTGDYTTLVDETVLTDGSLDYSLIRPANTAPTGSNYYPTYTAAMPYFHNRIPFESLANPEAHLMGYSISDCEGHPSGNTGLINRLSGLSDNRYKLMMNNFLAEVPRFFLKRKRFSTFQSLRQADSKFGNLPSTGSLYGMRIKIKRSMEAKKLPVQAETSLEEIFLPQDDPSMTENFTMYSRPSAFGPATCGISGPHGDDNHASLLGVEQIENDEYNHLKGYNFPFTPPYYHGEAWCDILFLPPSGSEGKVTIDQIFKNSRTFQLRFWQGNNNEFGTKLTKNSSTDTGSAISPATINTLLTGSYTSDSSSKGLVIAGMQFSLHPTPGSINVPINYNAMQVTSSVNIFTKAGSENDISSFNLGPIKIQTNVDSDDDARWTIQSKFETPMLNFNHVEVDLGAKGAELGPLSPRGLWHQHGRVPADDEGVFLEISDIPQEWLDETQANIYETSWNDNISGTPSAPSFPAAGTKIKSLADLVGFSKGQPIRMGELAERKTIKEAVVAVPFKAIKGRRNYFKIDRDDVGDALRILSGDKDAENTIGKSIISEIKAMKEYIIPPEMDFLADDNIDPFAMYFFEFKHELSKQDLSDIWQNLLPDIGINLELAETEISHELLSNELLGTERKLSNASKVISDDKQTLFDSEIQWMVFKVKEKAHKSYNNLMYGKEKEEIGTSYNWPYDYFSLVELVKIEAEVELSDVQEQDGSRAPMPVKSKRLRAGNIDEE